MRKGTLTATLQERIQAVLTPIPVAPQPKTKNWHVGNV